MEVIYREITRADLSDLAKLRAGTPEHWLPRIEGYYLGTYHPQHALAPRVLYAALVNDRIISFIAGHLTQRLNCEGELQWLDTVDEFRNRGIASMLVRILAKWFIDQKAYKICVDPGTDLSRKFYKKNGATNLNQAWMYWEDIRKII